MAIANVPGRTNPDQPTPNQKGAAGPPSGNKVALAVVTTLFFMWGFVTVLNDVLVPHLKSIFDLNYTRVMLIQFAFFSAYFLFSIPSARVIDWIGYKKTMVVGLCTMGLGALLFIPAASVPSYPLFLGALMVLAAGITALQVAANPYVAVLGPPETASSRLNLAQAFNSLGTTIAPYLGGMLILNATRQNMDTVRQMSADALQAYRIHEASSVKLPYLIIGLALIGLGAVIAMFKLPAMPEAERRGATGPKESVWKYRHLVLAAIGIFVYVGAEVSIGSFLINYFTQTNIGNVSEVVAAGYVSYYWGGAMVGRFIGSAILQKLRYRRGAGNRGPGCLCAGSISMLALAMWRCGPSSSSVSSIPSCFPASSLWASRSWARSPGMVPACWSWRLLAAPSFRWCKAPLPTVSVFITRSYCRRSVTGTLLTMRSGDRGRWLRLRPESQRRKPVASRWWDSQPRVKPLRKRRLLVCRKTAGPSTSLASLRCGRTG